MTEGQDLVVERRHHGVHVRPQTEDLRATLLRQCVVDHDLDRRVLGQQGHDAAEKLPSHRIRVPHAAREEPVKRRVMALSGDTRGHQGSGDGVASADLDPTEKDDQGVAPTGLREGGREPLEPVQKRANKCVGHGALRSGVSSQPHR